LTLLIIQSDFGKYKTMALEELYVPDSL